MPDQMISRLAARGVRFPAPQLTYLSPDLVPERFHEGAVVYQFCRIEGADSALGPGAEVGAEGPVTLRSCQLGAGAGVASGFADRCTLLDGARAGAGFHGRPGTLMEEFSGVAHSVGLKQTVLFPFVEFGSLVNFCDAIVSGGTGPGDHSEVGSSYVHFNFTPHGDKATASLVGDVPRGALLRAPRIFLGGQGGLVGPRRVAFGAVVPAGTVLRRDVAREGALVRNSPPSGGADREWDPANFGRVRERADTCLEYLGNVLALRAWYDVARAPFMRRTPWGAACLEGARERVASIWKERVKRLRVLFEKAAAAGAGLFSAEENALAALEARWTAGLAAPAAGSAAAAALEALAAAPDAATWPAAVQSLPQESASALAAWLRGVSDFKSNI